MDKNCENPDCECLEHVCCEVCECRYNDEHNHCTAGHINVCPHCDGSSNETACGTFECR